MFRATYLGHHGWLFESDRGRLLVDPIFTERFGFSDATELRLYPPRRIDIGSIPEISAVFLTHEHEGHFEPGSLCRLDRKTPIFLSPHSSIAMGQALEEMGFRTTLVRPGEPERFGDLELLPLATDQVSGAIEEWDVMAYLVRDEGGDGSFVSSVDMPPTTAMRERVERVIPRPGLWGYTTNYHQYPFQTSWLPKDLGGLRTYVRHASAYHEELVEAWNAPAATLVLGGGWCFGGPISWLNANAFTFESEDAERVLSALYPDHRTLAPLPGDALSMRGGEIVEIGASPFMARPERSEWPSRAYVGDVPWLETYEPACGRKSLTEDELARLGDELAAFARHLYGGGMFRELLSLSTEDCGGKRPTVALSLLDGEDRSAYVFAYDPAACDFTPAESVDPVKDFVAVYEAWGTDLLATFEVQMSQNAIGFGRSREWNAIPARLRLAISHALFVYVHPLRHPERFLRLYREVIARHARADVLVRALV